MKEFAGKVAFITGGASGLGFGLAKVFSEAGCKIVIADIRKDHLDQAKKYFKDKEAEVLLIKLDVANRKEYAKAADKVEKVFGKPPELLFNNAGVNSFGRAEAATYEDWDWIMGVNLNGVINGMQTFVQRMIKAGKGGHIVSTASFAGLMGHPIVSIYAASKAAVINMMESYRISLEPYEIGVSVCCPGGINTNIHEAILTRPKHLKKTGHNMDELAIKSLKTVSESGMDPVDLAKYIKNGIEKNKLYIIPYPDIPGSTKRVENHFNEILSSIPDESEVPPEIFKVTVEGMSHMKNVGKPRHDMPWIKPINNTKK